MLPTWSPRQNPLRIYCLISGVGTFRFADGGNMIQILCCTRFFRNLVLLTGTTAVMLSNSICFADERADFFEARIRPLLINRCSKCHAADTEQNGGLVLDSKTGWEVGGDSGTAIVPHNADASLLIKAVRWDDSELQMPPQDAGGRLTAAEIRDQK